MQQQMKIPRLMRIFKLVKLVRVLKASSVIQRWQIYTVLWLNNNAYTPDNPCLSLHSYAASLHWSTMSVTSIGYGDIVPVRFVECSVGILCQIVDGIIWANLSGASAAHCPRATLSRSASRSTPIC